MADDPSTADLPTIAAKIRTDAGARAKITFVSGNFNILHPGHLRLLKFAAEIGDTIVVGLHRDGTPGVTVPGTERLECVRALAVVDRAVLLTVTPADFIALLKPDFVVKGSEFEDAENLEQAAVSAYGGKLIFGSGETVFSSSLLEEPNFSAISKPRDYPQRHGFEIGSLLASLEKFRDVRVLVIGDTIIDEYVTCDPLGMSQEDPTIVVTPIETKTFVGGAGVVAAHAKALGAKVSFFSVVGSDDAAKFARESLIQLSIDVNCVEDATRPTTRKQRFRAGGKTLLRVNHLRQHAISLSLVKTILRQVEDRLAETDLVLFSDFNYGCLPQGLVEAIADRAAARGIMMAADSQASSQMADISRFKGMTLVTPTEREARLALRDTRSGLAVLAERLAHQAQAESVIITLASEGLLVYARGRGETYLTDRLPAFNAAPKDVAGAGDSLFTSTALALCSGVEIWQGAYLGALAAACQVSRVGNAPLDIGDLRAEIMAPDPIAGHHY